MSIWIALRKENDLYCKEFIYKKASKPLVIR